MQCPKCGEKRVARKKEMWGSGNPQFWDTRFDVTFLCGGRYTYDGTTNTYTLVKECKVDKEA